MFRSLYDKQGGHTASFYTLLVSNVRQLFAAVDFSRRHFQMHFFLGALRVKKISTDSNVLTHGERRKGEAGAIVVEAGRWMYFSAKLHPQFAYQLHTLLKYTSNQYLIKIYHVVQVLNMLTN